MTLESLNKKSGRIIKTKAPADDEQAWPEEIEAMINIREGRVETEIQNADDLIAELKELENEP